MGNKKVNQSWWRWMRVLLLVCCIPGQLDAGEQVFARSNLVAWCLVPFDAKRRGPEERARMLVDLGFRHFAYDWRDEHIPTFNAEIEAMQRQGVAIDAWWFPAGLGPTSQKILAALERHKVRAQLWITLGDPAPQNTNQAAKVKAAAGILDPIAAAAGRIGCQVALYNHGGWFGEPENQVAIIEHLRRTNVGIVYNFHHGHDHIDRFAGLMRTMQPHLLAINLNGMVHGGDRAGKKILTLGQGDAELGMLRIIRDSGWQGLIGIIDHRPETDSADTLRENLEGLDKLLKQLKEASPPPKDPQTGKKSAMPMDDPAERAKLPEFQVEPAANVAELTPANGYPYPEVRRLWHRSHGDASSARFSGLDQINRTNVAQLRVAWTYRSKDGQANIQCNPIIVDGMMFLPTAGGYMAGIDAATGVERWRFKPELAGAKAGMADVPARRGLVYWPGDLRSSARLFFSFSRWVYAINPKDGRPITEFGTEGRVPLETAGTVAGAVFRDVLVIPGFERDVYGFDVRTGQLRWRFHTIPKPGEFGADTWDLPELGANCWGGMALDDQRGIAYVATGSPKPDFLGMGHRGQNLFANCVIALDALTGRRLWHFQEVRHDIWDWDIPSPPILATITREGRRVDVVVAVTKLGHTLVLDRVTGKSVYPFRLRRAPVTKLPGEMTWPYQPDPEIPEPFVRREFRLEDVTQRSEEATEFVMKVVARANYGWFATFEEGRPTVIFNEHGGAEWTGASYDPRTSRIYISANEIPWYITVYRDDELPRNPKSPPTPGEQIFQVNCAQCHGADRRGLTHAPPLIGLRHRRPEAEVLAQIENGKGAMPAHPHLTAEDKRKLLDFLYLRDRPNTVRPSTDPVRWTFGGWQKMLDDLGYPGCTPPWGTLVCLDLNTGKIAWKVPLGEYPELTAYGITKTGTENFGGATATAGDLVFVSGTRDKKIRAFDARAGAELWAHDLPLHGTAPPASYEVNGKQYLVVPATGGGKLGGETGDAWVAFTLPD